MKICDIDFFTNIGLKKIWEIFFFLMLGNFFTYRTLVRKMVSIYFYRLLVSPFHELTIKFNFISFCGDMWVVLLLVILSLIMAIGKFKRIDGSPLYLTLLVKPFDSSRWLQLLYVCETGSLR